MANHEHVEKLRQGADSWNRFRRSSNQQPDLAGAMLDGLKVRGADLGGADLRKASITEAELWEVNLAGADLRGAFCPESDFSSCDFSGADLRGTRMFFSRCIGADFSGAHFDADTELSSGNFSAASFVDTVGPGAGLSFSQFCGADLRGARFGGADFNSSNLMGADLRKTVMAGADLTRAVLVDAKVGGAIFAGARIYGVSAWNLDGAPADESDLIVTSKDEPSVTVGDLEVAQFVYLLLNNERIRDVIDTVTTKTVLILGRFAPERKRVLDRLRDLLKEEDYVGIIFDFDPSTRRNLTETISTLAHMSRFIIADLTDPRSVQQELTHVTKLLPSVPVQPIIRADQSEWAMFTDLKAGGTVLATYAYRDVADIERDLRDKIIAPAERFFDLPSLEETRAENAALRKRIAELEARADG